MTSGSIGSALRHRNFALFWTGALISNIGSWMQSLAVPFVIYEATGSAAWVGFAAFMQFFPTVLLAPLGGSLADRYPRRMVLLVTQTIFAALAFALWGAWIAGVRSPLALTAIVGAGGVVAGVNIPSWQAFISELVPREDLLGAITLNSAQFNASRAIGPAIGGLVVATLGPAWAFFINGVSFAAVIVALALITTKARVVTQPETGVLSQFAEGVRHLWAHRAMRYAYLLVVAMAFFGNPMLSLATVVARSVYDVGAVGLGALTAAFGVGAVIGAVVLSRFARTRPASEVGRVGFTLFAGSVVLFGASPAISLGLVALFAAGFAYLVAIATFNTVVQLNVAEELRGRVMGFYVMGFTAAYPLGALLQGALAQIIGVQLTIVLAGSCLVAISAGLFLRPAAVRQLDGEVDHPMAPTGNLAPVAGS